MPEWLIWLIETVGSWLFKREADSLMDKEKSKEEEKPDAPK